ncbi:MAG: hypothetical protein DRQ44_14130 [Gammaproteobacteria bacterium]|nr:MAG: hypothetical protein DRQ44_14130 [Gammaproteobacteria bacterium]
MLQAINDKIKGWLGIVIVVLIGLPFALWGIQSYLDDTGPRYAAKVNNIEISANEFERTVSRQRQELLRQYGGEMPVEEKALREQTLNQIINQKLLEDFTYQNSYRISDSVLSAKIKQQFSNEGIFDRERFEMIVASNGMTLPMYEAALRSELRVQQAQSALTGTSFVTKSEVSKLAAIDEQTRDIKVLTFNIDHYATSGTATAEEIKEFYESNRQRFLIPEKLKVDYVEITSDSLAGQVEIDEQQIKDMYDEYVATVGSREQRMASHILISATGAEKDVDIVARALLDELKQKLDNGADFATLAKEHSQDPGSAGDGGDLGWVSTGEMVKPFEQALFDMEKGAVSDVVQSQFGYHIIKLVDIRSEEVQPIGIKRYEFEDELKADAVASIFYDQSERLASIAYENPDNLDVAAQELGLEIKTSEYFGRFNGEGIAEDEKLRKIAFSNLVLEQASNSDIIELSPTHLVVVRMNEYVPAMPVPLETVTSKIENILKVQNGHKQAMAAALDVKTKLTAGETIDSLKAEGIFVESYTALQRKDSAKVSDVSLLNSAFEMGMAADNKTSYKVVDLTSGDVALIVLSAINNAENVSEDRLAIVKADAMRENAIHDYSSALRSIENNAKIERNIRDVE